ncbi:MAG: SCO family protein [Verrucomicrobia bacterium]|nr:SCO family protein [Verrucomicrobiota bacterium]
MRENPIIARKAFWFAASVSWLVLLTGCAIPGRPSGSVDPGADALSGQSLYQLDSMWTSDEGREIKLAALRGRVQVVAMMFTRCQYACPAIVHDLKRIEGALSDSERANVGFTLISFDSERDSVEALRDYRQTQRLAPGRWTLLRGGPDDVLELAALLGVKFKKDASGQFSHSTLIATLNPEGEIVLKQSGLHQDLEQAVRAVRSAAAGARKARPVAKPEGKRAPDPR